MGCIGVAMQPLTNRLVEELWQQAYLHADETPVRQLDSGSGKIKHAYLWSYRSGVHDKGPPIVVFDYRLKNMTEQFDTKAPRSAPCSTTSSNPSAWRRSASACWRPACRYEPSFAVSVSRRAWNASMTGLKCEPLQLVSHFEGRTVLGAQVATVVDTCG